MRGQRRGYTVRCGHFWTLVNSRGDQEPDDSGPGTQTISLEGTSIGTEEGTNEKETKERGGYEDGSDEEKVGRG